jgi:hypothetical protein
MDGPNGNLRIGGAPSTRIVRDDELLRLLLTGFTVKEASQHMRAGYITLCKVARSPEFLLKIKEHSGEIAKRLVEELSTSQVEMAQKLEDASSAALDEMIVMMNELPQSGLKVKICQDLLDRDPKSSRTKRLDIGGTLKHDFINPAILIHAAATARELEVFQAKKGELTDGNGSSDHHADSGNGSS